MLHHLQWQKFQDFLFGLVVLENRANHDCQLNYVWYIQACIHLKCIPRTLCMSLLSCLWRSLEISWTLLLTVLPDTCTLFIAAIISNSKSDWQEIQSHIWWLLFKSPSQNDIFFLAQTWAILKDIMSTMLHSSSRFLKIGCCEYTLFFKSLNVFFMSSQRRKLFCSIELICLKMPFSDIF